METPLPLNQANPGHTDTVQKPTQPPAPPATAADWDQIYLQAQTLKKLLPPGTLSKTMETTEAMNTQKSQQANGN